ncbi:MAG: twitching motility protein PilT [Deltaproteobacteria bacterium]|nr:twitching motility protein PilT [Deltaproteobacteria bacterium]
MIRWLFDAGALIALDRNDRAMWARFALAHHKQIPIITHGAVVGQVWRKPPRQARLAQALRAIEVRPLDLELGKLAGRILATSRTADVVDAALVALCRRGDRVYTSDPDDLHALATAAGLDVEVVMT